MRPDYAKRVPAAGVRGWALRLVLVAALLGPGAARGLSVCAHGPTLEGVDVTQYQNAIDWAQVQAAGKSFAFVRATDGTSTVDAQFAANWSGTLAAGLTRGAYHVFNPAQDPTAQADAFLAAVGDLQLGDLLPAVVVDNARGLSAPALQAALATYTGRIRVRTGQPVIVYTTWSFWNDSLGGTGMFAADPLWIGSWGGSCPNLPTGWSDWSFWQYTGSGSVPGITGSVPLDRFNGDAAALAALTVRPSSGGDGGCGTGPAGSGSVLALGLALAWCFLRLRRRDA